MCKDGGVFFPFSRTLAWFVRGAAAILLIAGTSGCGTIRRSAMRSVSGALVAGPGGNVYTMDDDPELIRDALPFALKTYEMLLAQDPQNRGLHAATAAAYVQYANAFVQADADQLEGKDFEGAQKAKKRAAKLYLRGRNYALAGLELDHPGFRNAIRKDTAGTVAKLTKKDVPLAFWAGLGWAAAIAADPGNMDLVGELPFVEAILRRVLALDESYSDGGVHEFFITFEGSRSEAMGGSPARAEEHFKRAVELSRGNKASPYVALASSVAVRAQDLARFKSLLNQALAVDVNAVPAWRLANVIAQERARELLSRIPELFVEEETTP
jgi:predicted anti-sigma-YlaC factor YlaD